MGPRVTASGDFGMGMGSRPGTSAGTKTKGGLDKLSSIANRLKTPMYISDRAMPGEEETINAIKNLLRIPALTGRTEESLADQCKADDGLAADPDFPPGPTSLYPDQMHPPAMADSICWRRVAGTLYIPTGNTPKILQGVLDNHNFLGALAAVAAKQDLLLDLIVSDDWAHMGLYTLQFYKHGCWHQVVVDNYLPCIEGEDRLAFACSGNVGELWPSVLEKAYAKLHGSYYSLEGGSVHEALVDLTGGVASKIRMEDTQTAEDVISGKLWQQLVGWLQQGSILACQAKSRQRDTMSFEGPAGLLLNHVYSIMDAKEIQGSGTHIRLVRLHCAWPAGIWQGPWSPASPEWQQSAVAPHLAYFRGTMQDEATFWMSYRDFCNAFNRLYVCRLFPPTWHQLTLHCGWHGPSAGGPYTLPASQSSAGAAGLAQGQGQGQGVPQQLSSSWCCNPQFRVTVRKACEVIVCLAQQDPMVANRSHVRKAERRRAIGMQLLRIPVDGLGRRWEVRAGELLRELPLSAGREVSASFRAEPEYAYVIVPYAGRPGEEGAFVLRTFSASPLEVEQLPSPLSLVLGGHWAGYLAGGSRNHPSWASNPQYMISVQHKAQVVLSVSRLDVKYSIMKPAFHPEGAVGLVLVAAERSGVDGAVQRRTAVRNAAAEVVAESAWDSMEEAVVLVTLEPETPYILVPSLASPQQEAPFEVRIMSGVAVELVPLPEMKTVTLRGEWGQDSAGGCDIHPLWKKNPRFLLQLAGNGRVKIMMHKVGRLAKKATVEDMIGFYVLRASGANGEIRGDLRKAVAFETTFVTVPECGGEVELTGGMPYVVMPCTYAPGRYGKFTLAVTCVEDFEFIEL